ncbi:putative sodium-glucose/galactose cotransporter [Desulfosporosinus sp. BG]|nr:putative sodium-glucose/galactose cotransporter [Desulfosporosinus sp. BG]
MNQGQTSKTTEPLHLGLLVIFALTLIWSVINPKDLFTWFLEVFPALIGLAVIIITYHRFRLTNLVYVLVLVHALILVIGGHYTYAEMPFFNWLRDNFHLARNYYDRLGHFAQGFVPAIICREVLLRKSPLKRGKLLSFLVICICLAISASYELIEWGVAEATGSAADAFQGTQGMYGIHNGICLWLCVVPLFRLYRLGIFMIPF